MNEFLIITNDADDTQLINFAYQFAYKNGKDLTVAQLNKPQPAWQITRELVSSHGITLQRDVSGAANYTDSSKLFTSESYLPKLKTVDASSFTENELADYIQRNNFSLVISRAQAGKLNFQLVLNQINCPLMLVPEGFTALEVKRMVYLTDLRYCQQHILGRLARFKRTSLLVAHICHSGLPDLDNAFANELFADTAGRYCMSAKLFFSHIKERNFKKLIDTLVNTMQTDMLVCLNKQFHFQKLLGDNLPKRLPEHIAVPVLIFP
jgi:hypothetical protein